jgi:hypothetical protein
MAKSTDKASDSSLKRLGGGRWQTRDERFTIEPQSGTWVVVDAEQTDDLGLPLVRGPFGSLGDAKESIARARTSEPASSPLTARVEELRARPSRDTAPEASASAKRDRGAASERPPGSEPPREPERKRELEKPREPAEPRWLTDLDPAERRRALRLIERLTEAGAVDPEGIARRDIVGDVPDIPAFAIVRRIEGLGPGASPASVARLLADGRDEDLDVRWRLVDGAGRPITLDLGDVGGDETATRRRGRNRT